MLNFLSLKPYSKFFFRVIPRAFLLGLFSTLLLNCGYSSTLKQGKIQNYSCNHIAIKNEGHFSQAFSAKLQESLMMELGCSTFSRLNQIDRKDWVIIRLNNFEPYLSGGIGNQVYIFRGQAEIESEKLNKPIILAHNQSSLLPSPEEGLFKESTLVMNQAEKAITEISLALAKKIATNLKSKNLILSLSSSPSSSQKKHD